MTLCLAPVSFQSGSVFKWKHVSRPKKRIVYLEGPGMQRFVLSLGFILKFCRKRYITVLKKKQGMPIKTRRKNIPEAQQMLFCYCMFCTDGAGVLKNTHLWFVLFACPSSVAVCSGKICQMLERQHCPLLPDRLSL